MVTVLKLGGSLITEKDTPETVDETALADAVTSIAGALAAESETAVNNLVIVHGGGSFGHHHAATHGVTEADGTTDATAVVDIHAAMTRLNNRVVDALLEADVEAVPVRPLSIAHRDDGDLTMRTDAIAAMLSEGFVPVLHGDVVIHRGSGVTILSGDEIVVSLASSLSADRIGLCSTVPGVLDEEGEVIPTIEDFEAVAEVVSGSEATDVTGGMAGKVRRLLALDRPASVFGPDQLEDFLRTGTAGSTIR